MNTSQTHYDDIYRVFMGRITDQNFLSLPNENIEELCFNYLSRAIPRFTNSRVDLSDRDDELRVFNFKLSALEIEILGALMIVEWLTPQVYNITLLKQFLNDSEYRHYSQANHLDKLVMLKDVTEDDVHRLIILYTNDIMDSIND